MAGQLQEDFIRENLEKYKACLMLNPKYKSYISAISPKTIKKILNSNFTVGAEMKAVLCLFNTLLMSDTPYSTEGSLYFPDVKIQNWINNLHMLSVQSSEGYIYITDVFSSDIQVIIKVPREYKVSKKRRDVMNKQITDLKNRIAKVPSNEHAMLNTIIENIKKEIQNEETKQNKKRTESLQREYFIGLRAINDLRYTIPTFSYTLGAFMCNKPRVDGYVNEKKMCTEHTQSFVLYEKIPGKSVNTLLESNEINFEQWLVMFAQVLLSLEIAQRTCKFTHFDLHSGNVMARPTKNMTYNVCIGESTYTMSNINFLPVIIDFGMATAEVDLVTVGSYDFPEYGMMHYMVQGYDMFKFLCYSTKYTRYTKYLDKMLSLFRFYGDDDPYNIYRKGYPALERSIKKYCAIGTYSKMAMYTPLQFFLWLYKEYNSILSPHITIDSRTIYRNIQYSSSIQLYDDIFQNSAIGKTNAIQLATQCVTTRPSYIMTKYNIKILTNYNKNLKSSIISDKIKELSEDITSPEQYISIDKARLDNVFKIQLPNMDVLGKNMKNILNIEIGKDVDKDLLAKFIIDIKYISELQPYMQMYYTILELNLSNIYNDWIQKFKVVYYENINTEMVSKTLRWVYTLRKQI